jgi:site-specific recombinase XerC
LISQKEETALMKPDIYLENYPAYLKGARDGANTTIKEYQHDIDRYIQYFKEKVDPTLETFCIDLTHIRKFVIFLRESGNANATVERRLHGVYAFWAYLNQEYGYAPPLPLKQSGVRIKKIRNPTRPIEDSNYLTLMVKVKNELSKID